MVINAARGKSSTYEHSQRAGTGDREREGDRQELKGQETAPRGRQIAHKQIQIQILATTAEESAKLLLGNK